MANEEHPPGAPRRRPPTVIDLPATEVPSEAAAPQPQAEANAEEPPEPPPGRRAPFAFVPEGRSWFHAGSAFAAAAGGLLVTVLFWFFGAFSGGREIPADPGPRLAAIEKQLKDLAARPMPSSVDPKAVDKAVDKAVEEVAARVARLESAQAAPRAPVTDPVVLGRLNAAENATKSLADNVAALSRRAEATDAALVRRGEATEAAVRDTNSSIGKLTATLADVQSTARSAAAGSDRASRLAVAASALRNAVDHGDPFSAELAIVKPLAPDANAVAALEPFAASGVPGNTALGQELAALVRPMLRASDEAPRDGNFIDRLQANAQKLVRVRPVAEEPRGDDRGAILARVEQRASQGNISGAMAELAKLPADARAPFQQWIAKAEARTKAIDASRRLAADAVAALKAAP